MARTLSIFPLHLFTSGFFFFERRCHLFILGRESFHQFFSFTTEVYLLQKIMDAAQTWFFFSKGTLA